MFFLKLTKPANWLSTFSPRCCSRPTPACGAPTRPCGSQPWAPRSLGLWAAWGRAGPSFAMGGKPGPPPLLPALLKPQLHFFQGWIKGNGLWKQGYNCTQINLSPTSHLPSEASGNADASGAPRTPLPLATEKSHACNSPITRSSDFKIPNQTPNSYKNIS